MHTKYASKGWLDRAVKLLGIFEKKKKFIWNLRSTAVNSHVVEPPLMVGSCFQTLHKLLNMAISPFLHHILFLHIFISCLFATTLFPNIYYLRHVISFHSSWFSACFTILIIKPTCRIFEQMFILVVDRSLQHLQVWRWSATRIFREDPGSHSTVTSGKGLHDRIVVVYLYLLIYHISTV